MTIALANAPAWNLYNWSLHQHTHKKRFGSTKPHQAKALKWLERKGLCVGRERGCVWSSVDNYSDTCNLSSTNSALCCHWGHHCLAFCSLTAANVLQKLCLCCEGHQVWSSQSHPPTSPPQIIRTKTKWFVFWSYFERANSVLLLLHILSPLCCCCKSGLLLLLHSDLWCLLPTFWNSECAVGCFLPKASWCWIWMLLSIALGGPEGVWGWGAAVICEICRCLLHFHQLQHPMPNF